jgi:hypothetical protein
MIEMQMTLPRIKRVLVVDVVPLFHVISHVRALT